MIYIAGKPGCTAAEQCRAEKAQEILTYMLTDTTCLGYELGHGAGRREYMNAAYRTIEQADAVIFLPDWKRHTEMQIQHMHCKYTGKRVMYFKITPAGAVLTLPRRKRNKTGGKKDGRH